MTALSAGFSWYCTTFAAFTNTTWVLVWESILRHNSATAPSIEQQSIGHPAMRTRSVIRFTNTSSCLPSLARGDLLLVTTLVMYQKAVFRMDCTSSSLSESLYTGSMFQVSQCPEHPCLPPPHIRRAIRPEPVPLVVEETLRRLHVSDGPECRSQGKFHSR
jgi:hypothetical protein